MDDKQKINCTVSSCKYNEIDEQLCSLNQIVVEACPNCSNGTPQDESMCGSYKCKHKAQ